MQGIHIPVLGGAEGLPPLSAVTISRADPTGLAGRHKYRVVCFASRRVLKFPCTALALVNWPREDAMRDIRNDLQERADLIQDRIKAARAHFERMVEQLRGEHDARVADLKTSLAMIAKLIEFEQRLIASAPSDLAPPPSPPEQPPLRRVI
jgi:hypothetical protein